MIRANYRMNANSNGLPYMRIQFYGLKGGYMTNEMIRVQYALMGFVQIEKESVVCSTYYHRDSLREIRSQVRKVLNNPKAKVIFTSTGRKK